MLRFDLLQRCPTPLAGLALGITSVGNLLDGRFGFDHRLQWFTATVAMVLLLAVVTKFALFPKLARTELAHPVVGAVMPTITMALMMLSQTIALKWLEAATVMWLVGVVLHLLLLLVFLYHCVKSWSLAQVSPPWFIPPVGIIVAALTVPTSAMMPIAEVMFALGALAMIPLLPLVCYRLVFVEFSDPKLLPTFVVMTAPVSMVLAGYLAVAQQPAMIAVAMLLGLALTFTAIVYLTLPKLVRLPFSPSFSAMTFPMVVSATAVKALLVKSISLGWGDGRWLQLLADVELAMAATLVVYVSCRYLLHYRPWRLLAVEVTDHQ